MLQNFIPARHTVERLCLGGRLEQWTAATATIGQVGLLTVIAFLTPLHNYLLPPEFLGKKLDRYFIS
jgi:hypothetical protein